MTTVLTEGKHDGGFLISEANHTLSREQVILQVGFEYEPGMVLGKITASGHYRPFDNANGDGSQTAAAINFASVDATAAEKPGVVIARNAEVNGEELVWATGVDSGEQEAAIATLRTLGIVTR